jgi:hypothetical protein
MRERGIFCELCESFNWFQPWESLVCPTCHLDIVTKKPQRTAVKWNTHTKRQLERVIGPDMKGIKDGVEFKQYLARKDMRDSGVINGSQTY